jgi:hypothetical protein
MNGDKEFAHSLAGFLAMHTEQSSGYLFHFIRNCLRGPTKLPRLEAAEKKQIIDRLTAEVRAHNNVPSIALSLPIKRALLGREGRAGADRVVAL